MKYFDNQEDAIKFCEEVGGNDHGIFVLHNFKGKTRFCVGTYEKFADTYLSYPVDICHIYEVVRDRKPVRLYFSIDIPDCDGVAVNDSSLVDILIRIIRPLPTLVNISSIQLLYSKATRSVGTS